VLKVDEMNTIGGERQKGEVLPPHQSDDITPAYYTTADFQVVDVIEKFGLCFHAGNVLKYVIRAGQKGPAITDYKKAKTYIERLIMLEEKKDD